MSMFVCLCEFLCLTRMQVPTDVRLYQIPGTKVKGNSKSPCECWESNRSPLEEQSMMLTTEPSLQAPTPENS